MALLRVLVVHLPQYNGGNEHSNAFRLCNPLEREAVRTITTTTLAFRSLQNFPFFRKTKEKFLQQLYQKKVRTKTPIGVCICLRNSNAL